MSIDDPGLLADLRAVVGPDHVLCDPEVTASYVVDWTGRFRGPPTVVVRPGTTAEVAAVVAECRTPRGVAVVPQGGNTGMVGGGVPLAGELVLSLRRLDAIEPVDEAAGQVTAGAGVTLGAVRQAAAEAGWAYGVDFAARDSCTIGGNVATNAGGLRVLRYGDTRTQVLGIEAVLGNGDTVSHLGGLLKDNTGYALPALFCGSEGTLGVVTAVRLRLVPPAPERLVALLAFDDSAAAVAAAGVLRRTLPVLSAAELILQPGLELVCRATGAPAPFSDPHPAYLVVEASALVDPSGDLSAAVDGLGGVADVAVAEDSVRAAALWRYREGHTEAINAEGRPHKLDVTLPTGALAEFVERAPTTVAAVAPTADTWVFGHVADGNIHVNVTGLDPDDDRADDALIRLVASYGGSISAEHGIGTAKRRWLHLNRSPAEIAAFRAIKRALDPDGICNPNVLLPAG